MLQAYLTFPASVSLMILILFLVIISFKITSYESYLRTKSSCGFMKPIVK